MYVCTFVCLVGLFIYYNFYLCICFICLFCFVVCLFLLCLFVCLFVLLCLFVCLFVCLFFEPKSRIYYKFVRLANRTDFRYNFIP